MAEKWWRTEWGRITEVEIDRELKASVVIHGQRKLKKSDWMNFFKTWEEAKAHLLVDAQEKVDRAERNMVYEIERLDKIKGMVNPEPEIEEEI